MSFKEPDYPIRAKKLEAIRRRLAPNHEKALKIEQEYMRVIAGYRGETSLKYHLSFLSEKQFHILHGIRLPSAQNEYFFQIDMMILSKYFFLLIEVKNLSGSITYDPAFQQIIQLNNGKEKIYQDPILQVERQKSQFLLWLTKHKITALPPIHTLVVLSNSQAYIKATSSHKDTAKIIRPDKLPIKISEYENIYRREAITDKELNKLNRLIHKNHTPEEYDAMDHFQLTMTDLISGVHCPRCEQLPMLKRRYSWYCPNCQFSSKDAYLQSLHDYYYLFGPYISNSQLRNFLGVPSRHSAQRLLHYIETGRIGNRKSTKYLLPFSD